MPHQPLNVFVMSFGLSQGGNGTADDLERQLRQPEFPGEFVQDAMAIVARIQRSPETPRKHERIRERVLAFFSALLPILRDFARQEIGDRNLCEALPGLPKWPNSPFTVSWISRTRLSDLALGMQRHQNSSIP